MAGSPNTTRFFPRSPCSAACTMCPRHGSVAQVQAHPSDPGDCYPTVRATLCATGEWLTTRGKYNQPININYG